MCTTYGVCLCMSVQRLVDTKYYGHSLENMVFALSEIKYLGCKFIVGGRAEAGRFVTLEVGWSMGYGLEHIPSLFLACLLVAH